MNSTEQSEVISHEGMWWLANSDTGQEIAFSMWKSSTTGHCHMTITVYPFGRHRDPADIYQYENHRIWRGTKISTVVATLIWNDLTTKKWNRTQED